MRGDEIHADPRLAPTAVEAIGRGGKASRHLGLLAFVTLPPSSYGVAELVVPLRPARRKAAHLIATGSNIPRFCDQFDRGQHLVLQAGIQEAMALIEAIVLTGQYRPEI